MLDVLKFVGDLTFWTVVSVVLIAVLAGMLGVVFGPVSGGLLLIVLLFALVLTTQAVNVSRCASAMMTLNFLQHATRRNLPLGGVIEALGAARVVRRKDARAARREIDAGNGIAASLSRLRAIPAWAVKMTAGAEVSGQLDRTLGRASKRLQRSVGQLSQDQLSFGLAYALMMTSILLLLLAGLSLFIIPQFVEIFDDFNIEVPWQTSLTFDVANSIQLPLAFVAWLLLALLTAFGLWTVTRGVPPVPAFIAIRDALAWWLPVWRGAERRRCYAEAAWQLGDGLGAGMPLHVAIRGASTGGINRRLRLRLATWADRVEAGEGPADAARKSGLPNELAAMTQTAAAATHPDSPLDFVARLYNLRAEGRGAVARAAILPVITLVFAVVVGWVAYSLLLPLTLLMEASGPEWHAL
ncbi:MAG: type II secretion system F family protein [Planctomycetota bacterium]